MSLLVFAGIAGGVVAASALAVGVRWVVSKRARFLSPASEPLEPGALPELASPAPDSSLERYGIALGDVILFRHTEAWVTGAIRLLDSGEEEVALFFTDQTAEGDVLLIRPSPRRSLFMVRAIELPQADSTPHTLEHERELYTRARQIPVTIEQHGRGHPTVGHTAKWAWFESPASDVIVCLHTASGTLAWRGRPVDEGSTIRLAAGKATFRDDE